MLEFLGSLGWLEWSAFVSGVVCVALIVMERDINWPIGVLNSVLLCYIFWEQKLYATVGLQAFYTFECLYGWWMWTRRDKVTGRKLIRIGNTPARMAFYLAIIGVAATAALYPILVYLEDPYPLADAAVGIGSLIAEYLLCLKLRQAWTAYFFCDLVTMTVLVLLARFGPPEHSNVAWVTFGQYLVFTFLCLAGMFEWRRRFQELRANSVALETA